MNIAMIGTGYVGLVTGACFANAGHIVYCLDNDKDKIAKLRKGIIPIYEPGLEDLVNTNRAKGNLHICDDPKQVIESAEIIFIAVGTPPDEDGSADLQHVLSVATMIGEHMNNDKVIVTKSTVPVGTADKVENVIQSVLSSRGSKHSFSICSNPEFLKEGSAVDDFNKPDRIIVGIRDGDTRACDAITECYAPFSRTREKLIFMDIRSSELTKYAANAMLATKISFINELSRIAESVGADIESVRTGIGSDTRIGYQFIYAGAGYGGSCFPKDVRALTQTATQSGVEPHLLQSVEQVNEEQKQLLFTKLKEALGGSVKDKCIAVWGLAFKPNTDDMRNAVSLVLVPQILSEGGTVKAFDPVATEQAEQLLGSQSGFELCKTRDEALDNADALVICTEWSEFRVLDFTDLKSRMNNSLIIDGRNIVDREKAISEGFTYKGIGR